LPVTPEPALTAANLANQSEVVLVPAERGAGLASTQAVDPMAQGLNLQGQGLQGQGLQGQVDSQKTVISKRPPSAGPTRMRATSPFEVGVALAGEMLGHFQLEEFVGGGGMGAVFRATDTMLGRTVAVKVVSRDETNEETLRRFRNEAQSAARLDHPNIARVYYVGEDRGWNYIVFEYIEGVNVRDLVEHNGPLSLEDAIRYTLQMAEALEHASQRDVTHRDIKPSNILIMVDGRAKLVDMGLARLHQIESATDDLTASGVTLGTFDYISPEQARDPRNTDVRSDLYSLGCTLYFMLTGQPPFPEGTVLQKLLSHSSEEPEDMRQLRPELPEDMSAIVKKLLAKQPEQRFQSPRELIGELLLLADRLNMTSITANSTVWLAPATRPVAWWAQHLPWMVPASLFLLLVLALFWWDRAESITPTLPRRLAAAEKKAPFESTGKVPAAKSEATANDERAKSRSTDVDNPTAPGETEESKTAKKIPTDPPRPAANSQGSDTNVSPVTERPRPKSDPAPDRIDPATSPSTAPSTEPSTAPLISPSISPSTAAAGNSVSPKVPATGETPPSDTTPPSPGPPSLGPLTNPRIIVVSDQDSQLDRSTLCVRSLTEALERAAELEQIEEIQLRFNGMRPIGPLDLQLDRYPHGRLTIRGADGFSPVLAFAVTADEQAPTLPDAMIRVRGGQLVWRNLHFYFGCAGLADEVSTASLVALESDADIEFSRCSFTVRNATVDGATASRQVSVIEVQPGAQLEGLVPDMDVDSHTPTIRLNDSVVRGQVTLVRCDQASPCWLNFEQGLFISSEQLVDVRGTLVEPQWAMGRISLGLKRLLVFADRGLCRVRTDSLRPYHPGVSVKAQDCLIATRLTKPATPLYLVQSAGPLALDGSELSVGGSNNYYKNTQVVLRVEVTGSTNPVEEHTFDKLQELDGQQWYSERNPQPATIFSWIPPAHTVDRQTLEDYIDPGRGDGWFMGDLQITPTALPRFPDYSTMLPRTDLQAVPAQARRGS
jgi:eukaryotic-like serine/threonine-protein kinase